MVKFIKCTGVNGHPIWLNTVHIVSFGIQPMSIRSDRGIGLHDGLWVSCVDCLNGDGEHSYVVDETPETFLAKIALIETEYSGNHI